MQLFRYVFTGGLGAVVATVTAVAPGPATANANPLTGIRTIAAAAGPVPQCLTTDTHGQVKLAALCYREGGDHSWKILPAPGGYLLQRQGRCLTFDPVRIPHLLAVPCASQRLGQTWQIAPRAPGHHQIGQAWVCITARGGEVDTDVCDRSDDGWGSDNSGQAWKILKDPQSIVPDPSFGGGAKPPPG